MVPLHYLTLCCFFCSVYFFNLKTYEIIGCVLTMGTICGHSINIAHELGHRGRKFEQNLAKILLLPIFREVAKKHGMTYIEMSYPEAIKSHFRFLKSMGKDKYLKRMNFEESTY